MGRIPGVIWRPIPENGTQAKIRPTQWIVHTFVDAPGPTNMAGYFHRSDITLESHTVLGWTKHEQLLDTTVRGDANYKANRRPDGTGAVSTETEDDGSPVLNPWNSYQVTELIRTGLELHRMHGIPARLPRTHDDPGMGYHSLFPMVWTNVRGKTCPGSTRIRQFKEVVLPSIQRRILPAPTQTTPPTKDDDDVRFFARNPTTGQVFLFESSRYTHILDRANLITIAHAADIPDAEALPTAEQFALLTVNRTRVGGAA